MDVREKLEVIAHLGDHITYREDIGICYDSALAKVIEDAYMTLKSGVTVQEWISVKDGLPEFSEEEMERYRFFGDTFFPEFNVMILGATQATTLYFDGERWYDEECHCYCVTHWQPMPQPPKGE